MKRRAILLICFFAILACEQKEEKTKKNATMQNNTTAPIILINPFEVPENRLKEAVIYWEACRDFLKTQPGYISTKLHQSIKEDAKFMLINVAEWESPKAFMTASQKMAKELGVKPPEGLKANPSLYTVISE